LKKFCGGLNLAIKERGVKRNCQACGAVFYDLLNDPIICPKCGSEYDPEAILKSRKTRLPAAEEAVKIETEDAGVTDEDDIAGVELDDDEDVILPDVDDDGGGDVGVVDEEPLISDEEVEDELIDDD
tara:strand:+ start:174 stop:554 length:381 start_codon:yes stop_codon:yes gene_type:complete